MWLSYHTPLTDLRAFSNAQAGRLPRPEWAPGGPKSGFIRGFGAMTPRRPTDAGWMYEPRVCDARGVLRIPPYVSLPVAGRKRLPKILFRQVASDGGAVVHVDLGVWINLGSTALDANASASLLAAALDMPVSVQIPRPNSTDLSVGHLFRSGPALAQAWLWATTATPDTPPGGGWVLDGMPILFVTLDKQEALEPPEFVRYTDFAPGVGIDLRHFVLVHRGQPVRVYLLQLAPEADPSRAFDLEVCLKRLHIDTVCTRALLHLLGQGDDQPVAAVLSPPAPASIAPTPRSPASDRLQRNLLDISRRLRRLDRLARTLSSAEAPIHAGIVLSETSPERIDAAIRRVDAALRQQDVRPNVARSLRGTLSRLPGVVEEGVLDVQHWGPTPDVAEGSQSQLTGSATVDNVEPGEADRPSAGAPEKASLQWNTGFPYHRAAEQRKELVVGDLYLLRTAIQAGQNTIGGLTPGGAIGSPDDEGLETTPEGQRFFTVRFGVRATGAVIRPAGAEVPASSEAISDPLHCLVGKGSPPFDVDLIATGPGPVEVELTLYVNGGAVLRRSIALSAIDPATGAPQVGNDRPSTVAASTASGDLPPGSPSLPPPSVLSGQASPSGSGLEKAPSTVGLTGIVTVALPVHRMLRYGATAVSLEVSFENDRFRLGATFGSVKGKESVAVQSASEVLRLSTIAARQDLIALSKAYRAAPAGAGGPLAGLTIQEPSDALLRFAQIGARLHRDLFGVSGDQNVSPVLQNIAANIKSLGRGVTDQPRMQVEAERLPIPWGVIYDDPEPLVAADVNKEAFWGVRFHIHRLARANLAQPPQDTLDAQARRITACLNPNLDTEQKIAVLQNQRAFFHDTSVMGTLIESGVDLKTFIQTAVDQKPCNFLYFFCHATAAETLDRNAWPVLGVPTDAATIELDHPPLTVEQLRKIRIKPLPARPLVFMNTCSSAQGDYVFQSVFLSHFFGTWQASGFIGTDWELPTVFADSFGRLFLRHLLVDQQPVAKAFHSAARQTLALDNPFPLIYALYVEPNYSL